MKHLLLFIFIGLTLQGLEYKPSIGVKGILPISSGLESTAKCGRTCMGSISSKIGLGLVLNNDLKLTDFITISFATSYEYGALRISENHAEDPNDYTSPLITDYSYNSQIIKLSPGLKLFYTNNAYFNTGISYDIYINSPEKMEMKQKLGSLALNLGLGYTSNKTTIEFSLEGPKMIDIGVKGKTYINLNFAVFYNF